MPALRNRLIGVIPRALEITRRSRRTTHRARARTGDVTRRVARARHAAARTERDRAARVTRAVDAARIRAAAVAMIVIRASDRAARRPTDIGIERAGLPARAGAARAIALGRRAVVAASQNREHSHESERSLH